MIFGQSREMVSGGVQENAVSTTLLRTSEKLLARNTSATIGDLKTELAHLKTVHPVGTKGEAYVAALSRLEKSPGDDNRPLETLISDLMVE